MMNPKPLKVLVVDDEDFVRSLLDEVLQTLGHKPSLFGEAGPAIEACRAAVEKGEKFDVAILDLRLSGGLGGAALLAEFRKLDPDLRALAISGRTEEEGAVPVGFQGFLPKPFRIKVLSEALNAAAAGPARTG